MIRYDLMSRIQLLGDMVKQVLLDMYQVAFRRYVVFVDAFSESMIAGRDKSSLLILIECLPGCWGAVSRKSFRARHRRC